MTDDRIAKLEQQINAAQVELQALKAGTAAPAPMVKDEGVRIVSLLPEPSSLPDLKQMERLYRAVVALAPWPLDDKYDETKPLRGFVQSFRWLASKGRIEQPNARFSLNYWLDDCRNWLRDRNSMTGDVSATTLILAVYAAGDVRFVRADAQLGTTWELALSEFSGKPANADAWRRILREGASAVLPPSAPARRTTAPSNVRVVVGGGY